MGWHSPGIAIGSSSPINLPNWRVHDSDIQDDWMRAELAIRALRTFETI